MPNKTLAVKTSAGADATINTLPDVGQTTKANSLPVALASDDGSLVLLEAIRVLLAASPAVPTGAATATAQAAGNTILTTIAQALAGTLAVAAASLPLPTGAATASGQTASTDKLTAILAALAGTLTVQGAVTVSDGTGPLTIDATSLPLPTGAATQTTLEAVRALLAAALTINLPTGASTSALQTTGNTALASIAAALAGTLSVSATALPLPTGAATQTTLEAARALLAGTLTMQGTVAVSNALALTAGESHVGSVGSDSKRVAGTPTLTPGTYAAGKCLGGLFSLASLLRIAGKSATVQSATIHAKIANTTAIDLVIFRDAPSVTTGLVDNATFAVDPADFDKVSKVISFTTWNSLGTPSLSRMDGIGSLLSAASGVDLRAVLVARGSVTIASASDLLPVLGVYQD